MKVQHTVFKLGMKDLVNLSTFKNRLDVRILKHYAFGSTALFVLVLGYNFIGVIRDGFLHSMHLSQIQSMSMAIFILVLLSSLAGALFHHIIFYKPRARNAFALVFSFSTLKFLGTLLAFQFVGHL